MTGRFYIIYSWKHCLREAGGIGEDSLEEEIRRVLKEKVDPVLSEHFGGSQLTRLADGVAYVKLTGACASCPSAQDTLEDVVKNFVMGGVPEVKDVRLDTSVSEDLLDMARRILSGEGSPEG